MNENGSSISQKQTKETERQTVGLVSIDWRDSPAGGLSAGCWTSELYLSSFPSFPSVPSNWFF
jgi:hypothetical protein